MRLVYKLFGLSRLTPISVEAGIKFLALTLLLCSIAYGEPRAIIEGPKEALPGDLVVLDPSKSVADGYKWKSPDGLTVLESYDCQSDPVQLIPKLVFSTGKPGNYTFQLIVADKTAAIDEVTWTVKIGDPVVDPDPPEPPTGDYKKITEVSKASADAINDPVFRPMFKAAMENEIKAQQQRVDAGNGFPFEKSVFSFQLALNNAMTSRPFESQKKPWITAWRMPVDAEMQKAKPTTTQQVINIWKAATQGL